MLVQIHRSPSYGLPLENLFRFQSEIGQLFEGLLSEDPSRSTAYPALDVAEQGNESVVIAELPGVRKEDIRIAVRDGVLSISGERKQTALPEVSRWVRNEIPSGPFSRSLALRHEVDADAVTAELKNGILRVVLPKAAAARPREISVK